MTDGRRRDAHPRAGHHPGLERPGVRRGQETAAPVVPVDQEGRRLLPAVREELDVSDVHQLPDGPPGPGVQQVRGRGEADHEVQRAKAHGAGARRRCQNARRVLAPDTGHRQRQGCGRAEQANAQNGAEEKHRGEPLRPRDHGVRGHRTF